MTTFIEMAFLILANIYADAIGNDFLVQKEEATPHLIPIIEDFLQVGLL